MPRYNLTKYKEKIVYASEADLLNLIIFGCTAKDWEQMNPELAKKGYNLRDTATINQLVVLSNIEARVIEATWIKSERKKSYFASNCKGTVSCAQYEQC